MNITWEDRKNIGSLDGSILKEKPNFSFPYAWLLVNDETAQYVESHDYGYWNQELTEEQRQEVEAFYKAWMSEMTMKSNPSTII